MKSFNRFTKTCLTLLFVGLSLAGAGFLLGGWKNLKQEVDLNRKLETIDFDKVESLDIQTSIIIAPSKDKQFHLSYYHYLKDQFPPVNYRLKDKQLTINDNQPNSFINTDGLLDIVLHLSQQNWVEERIPRLEVPKGTSLKELKGLVDIGDIDLKNITIDTAELTVNVGPVKLSNVDIGTLHLDVDAGEIQLADVSLAPPIVKEGSSLLNKSSISLNTGDITATNLSLTGQNSIFTDIGNIDLQLNPKTVVNIEANTDLGSVSNHFQNQPNSQNRLILETNAGDIRVQ
ncbi:DUF4097 family beta strand repeat-containing protein [Streptococcus marmotae]|uniref:DUF4097 family beta strand repeat-containing protein n=1 Tax=Streptococcus marmotae TaxID=1825069 RepID=UPI000834FD1E|nr:DUF4097 family beta strand repeat-containing protein [Streptococcus marmotae]